MMMDCIAMLGWLLNMIYKPMLPQCWDLPIAVACLLFNFMISFSLSLDRIGDWNGSRAYCVYVCLFVNVGGILHVHVLQYIVSQ